MLTETNKTKQKTKKVKEKERKKKRKKKKWGEKVVPSQDHVINNYCIFHKTAKDMA